MQYYIYYEGQQVGPVNKEELTNYGLNPQSKVWYPGLTEWTDAANVAELMEMINSTSASAVQEWYILNNGIQEGPFTILQLANKGISADTMVWKAGFPEWAMAGNVEELAVCMSVNTPTAPATNNTSISTDEMDKIEKVIKASRKRAIAAIVMGAIGIWPSYGLPLAMGIAGLCLVNGAKKCYENGRLRSGKTNLTIGKILSLVGFILSLVILIIVAFYLTYILILMAAL